MNQSKSLPGFRVVSDVTERWPVDSDVVERRKRLEAVEWLRLSFKLFFLSDVSNLYCEERKNEALKLTLTFARLLGLLPGTGKKIGQ